MLASAELNEAIRKAEEVHDLTVPYFGWYWRDVDWDADDVTLAASPSAPPAWHEQTLEAMTGQPWKGGEVRFCESNKWGYPMFRVTGAAWVALRQCVATFAERPSHAARGAIVDLLRRLAPVDIFDTPDDPHRPLPFVDTVPGA